MSRLTGWQGTMSTTGGRLCFLRFHHYDSNRPSYRPREATFLQHLLPKGSVLFVNAFESSSTNDGFVSWYVVVVSPEAQTKEQWTGVWDQVSEELQLTYLGLEEKIGVVQIGNELKALDDNMERFGKRRVSGVQTGTWKNLEAAVGGN